MSDVQWLFVVLAALYGWECTGWLRWGAVALTSWSGRRWTLRHPGALAGNQRGGLVLAPPLPPLGTQFVASQYPLSLSPEGVLAFVATYPHPGPRIAAGGAFFRWADVRKVKAHGKKLRVNGTLFLTAASPGVARQLRNDLQQLAQQTAAERTESIHQILKRTFDAQAAAVRRDDFRHRSRPVRWLANLLVLYVFAVIPAAIWHFGFLRTWLGLLLGLLTLTLTTATLFYRAHRKLYPDAEDERFTHTLTIALAPSSAMRAHDALSRPLLENLHPLTAAQGLLGDDAFREFAQAVWRDVRHPALPNCPSNDPAAIATEQFFREAQRQALEGFLKVHRLNPHELCRAPQPTEAASRAYCPRCETQFATPDARCADCGGLALVAFTKAG